MEKKKERRRPVRLSKTKWQQILLEIMEGLSLRSICEQEGMPTRRTVFKALAKDEAKQREYAAAKDIGLDARLDEIIDIADDGSNDWMKRKTKSGDTITVVDHEHIQRSKLRIDVRQWEASKLKPKKYGAPTQMVIVHEPSEETDNSRPRNASDVAARVREVMAKSRAKKKK